MSRSNVVRYRFGQNDAPVFRADAVEYLRQQNPRLAELKRRYSNHPATRHSLWSDAYLRRELRLDSFRDDNPYLFQKRFSSDAAYALTTHYALAHDELGLLSKLDDDDLFGNYLIDFDDQISVSRDLLDSVLEINFLNRELNILDMTPLTVLDIGAGYGRLAHRMVQALPRLEHMLCTDAVAESTFLSEFYLRYRNVEDKASVVPLDEIEKVLASSTVQLATNIHSFGECTLASIKWWLDLLEANSIKFLFIVANGEGLGSTEADKTNIDYMPAIVERGYQLKSRQPKYAGSPSVQKYGLYPTYYYLFERE